MIGLRVRRTEKTIYDWLMSLKDSQDRRLTQWERCVFVQFSTSSQFPEDHFGILEYSGCRLAIYMKLQIDVLLRPSILLHDHVMSIAFVSLRLPEYTLSAYR
jgi:hypothetical protein